MINILFWNLNKKKLGKAISEMVREYDIHIAIFAECEIPITEFLVLLNSDVDELYRYCPSIGCDKITLFTRFNDKLIKPFKETGRMSIRNLTLPGSDDILLGMLHFPSKVHYSIESQLSQSFEIMNVIRDAEEEVGHRRTLLVGDFNMNPFESSFSSSNGFNAISCKQIALKKARVVQGKSFPFFYNPMWNFLGDETKGPPGTFYHHFSENVGHYWNILDQVLIRPEILHLFKHEKSIIIERFSNHSLLNKNGIPDKVNYSDHLPIFFSLTI